MAIERCPSGDRTRLHSSISSRVGRTVPCPNVLCSPTLGDVSDADRHPDNMDGVRSRWSLRHEGASFDSCRESRLLSTGCRVPVDASANAPLRAAESGWSRVGALVAAVILQVAYATHRNPWVRPSWVAHWCLTRPRTCRCRPDQCQRCSSHGATPEFRLGPTTPARIDGQESRLT